MKRPKCGVIEVSGNLIETTKSFTSIELPGMRKRSPGNGYDERTELYVDMLREGGTEVGRRWRCVSILKDTFREFIVRCQRVIQVMTDENVSN